MSRSRPTDETLLRRLVDLVRALPRERQEQLYAMLKAGDSVPVAAIADHFGVSWRTVQRAIKDGKVAGVRAGLRWAVTQGEFDRLKREGFPVGKPGPKPKGAREWNLPK